MHRPPWWQRQKDARNFLKVTMAGKSALLLVDMGCGKTRIVIDRIEDMFRNGAKMVYIAAPLAAFHVWINEWDLWGVAPVAFIDLQAMGWAGVEEAQKLTAEGFPVICLVTYETAWQMNTKFVEVKKKNGEVVRKRKAVGKQMHHIPWDLGILDEITDIKSPGSKVSRYFRTYLREVTKIRYGLTGTGYAKRPLDLYAPIKFIEKDSIFAGDSLAFRNEFAIPHPYIRGAVVGYRNLDKLSEMLAKCAYLLKIDDVLPDLPPGIHEDRFIELSPKSRGIYDELTEEMYVELKNHEEEGGTVTAEHIFSIMRKQAQITSGFVKLDSDDPKKPIIKQIGDEKLRELLRILENRDEDEPTIIVTHTNFEEQMIADAIEKKFKFRPKILNGSVKGAAAREKMRRDAAKDRAFIVKESVASKSIDLRYADMTIFYSHSPNTEDYEQMLRRNRRGGQTRPVTWVHLRCLKTVDIRLAKILSNDLKVSNEIDRNWKALIKA